MQTATAYRAIANIAVHTNPHTGIGIPNPAIATIVTGSRDTTVTTGVATALPFGSDLVATTAAGGDCDRILGTAATVQFVRPMGYAYPNQYRSKKQAIELRCSIACDVLISQCQGDLACSFGS